jgi:EAL domain-containing protein (putative c-di-GMP-specific phosphodiesterase class I)
MSVPEQILRLFRANDRQADASAEVVRPCGRLCERDLVQGLTNAEFELRFQPQLDLQTGEILSVEALIRWNRPGIGVLVPGEFMPFAEMFELAAELDDWVLGAAAEQVREWDRTGLPPFGVAMNVSAQQFHRPGFVDRLTQALARRGVSPRRMEIEITEETIMRNADASIEIFGTLHELGVSLSIDDFGKGYSSLDYLRRFAVDEIKIDRSFVKDMRKDARVTGIVRGIIELVHGLRLQVVAEGVENCEQLKRLMDLKCDRAQGFLIARPMQGAQLERFIDEWPRRWKTMTS